MSEGSKGEKAMSLILLVWSETKALSKLNVALSLRRPCEGPNSWLVGWPHPIAK